MAIPPFIAIHAGIPSDVQHAMNRFVIHVIGQIGVVSAPSVSATERNANNTFQRAKYGIAVNLFAVTAKGWIIVTDVMATFACLTDASLTATSVKFVIAESVTLQNDAAHAGTGTGASKAARAVMKGR